MVIAAGFNTYNEFSGCSASGERFKEEIVTLCGLWECAGCNKFAFAIYHSDVKFLLGNINSYKVFNHFCTPCIFSGGGTTPSLPSSDLIGALSPNQLIRDGEGREDTPLRAISPLPMRFPCLHLFFPFPLFSNISENYNTNYS